MLPDRSKRYAGIDAEPERLVLATNWQLVLIGIIMVGLLRLIFPHKALVEKLYHQDHLDELTLSYIENLYRAEPSNFDLTILLSRARPGQSDEALAQLLQPVISAGDVRQRSEARLLLLEAFERAIEAAPLGADVSRERTRLIALLEAARLDAMSPYLAGVFSAAAFRQEHTELGVYFLRRLGPDRPLPALLAYAKSALGEGRHVLAAEYFLLARKQTRNRDEARALFVQGISALMAASRFQLAMQAAQRDLGDLADDESTLRFLARTAQAAGEPKWAAYYAQRLVFRDVAPVAAGTTP